MESILSLVLALIAVHLIVAGIILVNIGKKKSKKPLVTTGVIMEVSAPIFFIMGLIIASSFSSLVTALLLFLFPIILILGVIVGLTYSVIFIGQGFSKHITKKIVIGFTLMGAIITLLVTPVVLISIFGLPIALM